MTRREKQLLRAQEAEREERRSDPYYIEWLRRTHELLSRQMVVERAARQESQRRRWRFMGGDCQGCYRRRCTVCRGRFYSSHPDSKYCSPTCQVKGADAREKERRHQRRQGKRCVRCSVKLKARRADQSYCTPACRQADYRDRKRDRVTDDAGCKFAPGTKRNARKRYRGGE